MNMKLYDLGVTVFVIIGLAIAAAVISQKYLGDDNVIEESSEEIIKYQTGIDIDLSPNSPEVKK